MKKTVEQILSEFCIPKHLKGYQYLKYMIELPSSPISPKKNHKNLLLSAAQEFRVPLKSIENCVKNAIDTGFGRCIDAENPIYTRYDMGDTYNVVSPSISKFVDTAQKILLGQEDTS